MKVLVVGGGAREHALAWKLRQSPRVSDLFVAPGNAGTARIATNLSVGASDIDDLLLFARKNGVDLTVVGPEVPLEAGIADLFEEAGLRVFGPTRAAARVETSKSFAKDLMRGADVPTAAATTFTSLAEALEHVSTAPVPMVVKADGLAAGKGVVVAQTRDEAVDALRAQMEERRFGEAGDRVLIEECLEGPEISVFGFSDGTSLSSLTAACDYKRAWDGGRGPNTGGMGSYSPPARALWNDEMEDRVRIEIMEPVVEALASQGSPYRGVLYAGLMVTAEGPRVLEFNCRLGDPEAQVILPRLKTELLEVMIRAAEGGLSGLPVEWDPGSCVGVVVASGGYPDKYATGYPIGGLDSLDGDTIAFHAGTREGAGTGETISDGGRVLTVVAKDAALAAARAKAYENVGRIRLKDSFYRSDIGAPE